MMGGAAIKERLRDGARDSANVLGRIAIGVAFSTFMAGAVFMYADWPTPSLPADATADRVVVYKSQRRLILLSKGEVLREYKIALGPHPVGPKELEGDGKTPEGLYRINHRNDRSEFHLSLQISYPNADDIARAKKERVAPGGQIMIHGLRNGNEAVGRLHRYTDWTDGCIAVTNWEIEELWRAVPDGTVIDLHQ